jgi:hypothetical protein
MMFFLCKAFTCICHISLLQWLIILLYNTIFICLNHSIILITMSVTTQLMIKHGLQPPPGSVGSLTCLTCCTEGMNTSSTSDLPVLLENASAVPDLIDQCDYHL